MKRHIPNTLTCLNLISGCVATYFALRAEFEPAFACIVVGAVFDFFDGFAARLLHVSSNIGKELDSLADDITFGFAPAAVVFSLIGQGLLDAESLNACGLHLGLWTDLLPFVAFLIAAFSALRLAKFNLDERQTTSFIGMPTPANALFWASLAVTLEQFEVLQTAWLVPLYLLGIALSCYLLVAEIPMFALKFKHYGFKGNELRYGFALCSVVLLGAMKWAGFAAVIVLYVVLSLVNNSIGTDIANEE